ncbi:MAG: J domain-containing protein, partial [Cyanobacteria bacterium J06635_11]
MTNPSSGPTQNASTSSFYDVLGLRPNASVQDIRRAYRDLSKLYHPDTTELESAIATSKFQILNEAYATLSSPEKRLTYDYQKGFSRLSVMPSFGTAPGQPQNAKSGQGKEKYSSNAYIDPTDRPLSAGEFFALFILGITFICCLILVVTLSITRGDTVLSDVERSPDSSHAAVQVSPQQPVTARPTPSPTPASPL